MDLNLVIYDLMLRMHALIKDILEGVETHFLITDNESALIMIFWILRFNTIFTTSKHGPLQQTPKQHCCVALCERRGLDFGSS